MTSVGRRSAEPIFKANFAPTVADIRQRATQFLVDIAREATPSLRGRHPTDPANSAVWLGNGNLGRLSKVPDTGQGVQMITLQFIEPHRHSIPITSSISLHWYGRMRDIRRPHCAHSVDAR